jgi:hypothetical protein
MGYQRVGVWTAREHSPARKLYERAGMTLTGKPLPSGRAWPCNMKARSARSPRDGPPVG